MTAPPVVLARPSSLTHPTPVAAPGTRWRGRILVLLAILLVALNLRAVVVSVGPLLAEISAGLRLSPATAGVITMLPTVTFALFGA